jgi:tRNA-dihydrouridine synthase
MFEKTGCDGVMIGRGAIHNPWLFRAAKTYLRTGEIPPQPTLEERIDTLKKHYRSNVVSKGERVGVLEMRKHLSGYLKGLPHISKFRLSLMAFEKMEPIFERLDQLLDADMYRDLVTEYQNPQEGSSEITCETGL